LLAKTLAFSSQFSIFALILKINNKKFCLFYSIVRGKSKPAI